MRMTNFKYGEKPRDFGIKMKANFVSSNHLGQYTLSGMCGCQHYRKLKKKKKKWNRETLVTWYTDQRTALWLEEEWWNGWTEFCGCWRSSAASQVSETLVLSCRVQSESGETCWWQERKLTYVSAVVHESNSYSCSYPYSPVVCVSIEPGISVISDFVLSSASSHIKGLGIDHGALPRNIPMSIFFSWRRYQDQAVGKLSRVRVEAVLPKSVFTAGPQHNKRASW